MQPRTPAPARRAVEPQLPTISPKLHVNVTDDIIAKAERSDSAHCMIADAIRKQFPKFKSISVDLRTIRFTDPAKQARYTYFTPLKAARRLVNFDQGRHSEPFAFDIRGAAQITHSRAGNPNRGRSFKGVVPSQSGTPGSAPTVLGGQPIPQSALLGGSVGVQGQKSKRNSNFTSRGNTRQYGIKALDDPAWEAAPTPAEER